MSQARRHQFCHLLHLQIRQAKPRRRNHPVVLHPRVSRPRSLRPSHQVSLATSHQPHLLSFLPQCRVSNRQLVQQPPHRLNLAPSRRRRLLSFLAQCRVLNRQLLHRARLPLIHQVSQAPSRQFCHLLRLQIRQAKPRRRNHPVVIDRQRRPQQLPPVLLLKSQVANQRVHLRSLLQVSLALRHLLCRRLTPILSDR